MKETDLQKLSEAVSSTIEGYKSCDTQADQSGVLANLQKLTNIVDSNEKRQEDNSFRNEQFQLNKDHVYAQDKLEEDRLKQQIKDNSEKNEIERLRLEIEKTRLDLQKEDLNQKRIDSRNDMRFRLVTFGITTVIGLAEVIIPLLVYRKLAYTNLNLIYKDEGRPTNDYKDAIKNIKMMIK
mgnify:FL=1